MATVQSHVNWALRRIGVINASQTPSNEDAQAALDALNNLIDQWAGERLTTYTVTRSTGTLTANQTSFTVGSGGNIDIAWPWYLDRVKYQDTSGTNDVEYPLGMLTQQAWMALPEKELTATRPASWYYEPTYPTGTLYPYPVSTGSDLEWVVYHPTAVSEYSALSETVSLPPGYRRFFLTNLAKELSSEFGVSLDPALAEAARDSKKTLMRNNLRQTDLKVDPILIRRGGAYDIRTDR